LERACRLHPAGEDEHMEEVLTVFETQVRDWIAANW
jgi:hypothetical protein